MLPKDLTALRKKRSEQLVALRYSKKISIRKLAVISGLSIPTIVTIENGNRSWTADSELLYIEAITAYVGAN